MSFLSESIEEKEARLKYFYHFDANRIANRMLTSPDWKTTFSQNPFDCLFTIFSEISDLTKYYSGYILSPHGYCRPSFFSELSNENTKKLRTLCNISIFHHCILHSFERALNVSSPMIELRHKNELRIRSGIYNSPVENLDIHTSQEYNTRKRNFTKQSDHYSKKLLESLNAENQSSSFLKVPEYMSNAALFLFWNNEINNLNRRLASENTTPTILLKTYTKLIQSVQHWRSNLIAPDKILFDLFIEKAYGFSLFADTEKLLYKIHCSKLDSGHSLKILEGATLISTLSDYFFTLPITYNRSIFLYYACEAILQNAGEKQSYPLDTPLEKIIYIAEHHSTQGDLFGIQGAKQISEFVRMLKYVTLPLVEDLWDVLLYKTNLPQDSEFFCKFITDNFNFFTCNYSQLPTNFFSNLGNYSDFKSIYDFAQKHFQKQSNIPELYSDIDLPDPKLRDSLSFIIKNLCNINTYTKKFSLPEHLLVWNHNDSQGNKKSNAKNSQSISVYQWKESINLYEFARDISKLIDY